MVGVDVDSGMLPSRAIQVDWWCRLLRGGGKEGGGGGGGEEERW